MNKTDITFVMSVIDPHLVITDYAVASYQRLRRLKIPFRLLIYPNCLQSRFRERHYRLWKRFDYVKILEPEPQTSWNLDSWQEEEEPEEAERYGLGALKSGLKVYKRPGPWETPYEIFDRELKRVDSRYVATVDADFEILDSDFVEYIIERMQGNPDLKVMSAEYTPTAPYSSNRFSSGYCILAERYHPGFCVYKREIIEFPESHRYRDTYDEGTGKFYAWDTSAFFQKRLRDELGCQMETASRFERSFMHYGGFYRNRSVTYRNVGLYRTLKIAPRQSLLKQLGLSVDPSRHLLGKVDRRISYLATEHLLPRLFNETERFGHYAYKEKEEETTSA